MSAYRDEFEKDGYSSVLDHASYGQTPAYQRERMSNENITKSRSRSVIGVAVLPIVQKKQADASKSTASAPRKAAKRSDSRKVTLSLRSYQRRLAAVALVSATVALGGLGLGKKTVQNYKDISVITTYNRAFDDEVIKPERHPTRDHTGYYFDYSDIAQKVMNYDNIDEAVYLLVFDIGNYQADKVLGCTPYRSLESFVESRGYSDVEDFRKRAREMLLLDDEIQKKQSQLNDMRDEHADYIFEPSKNVGKSEDVNDMFTESVPYDSDDVSFYSGGVK